MRAENQPIRSDALKEVGTVSDGVESIVELFNRNPSDMSDSDFDRLIRAMRLKREVWKKDEREGKKIFSRQKVKDDDIGI